MKKLLLLVFVVVECIVLYGLPIPHVLIDCPIYKKDLRNM